jgi:hypothetical protein
MIICGIDAENPATNDPMVASPETHTAPPNDADKPITPISSEIRERRESMTGNRCDGSVNAPRVAAPAADRISIRDVRLVSVRAIARSTADTAVRIAPCAPNVTKRRAVARRITPIPTTV